MSAATVWVVQYQTHWRYKWKQAYSYGRADAFGTKRKAAERLKELNGELARHSWGLVRRYRAFRIAKATITTTPPRAAGDSE